MEDALVRPRIKYYFSPRQHVLILVLMEDALVLEDGSLKGYGLGWS